MTPDSPSDNEDFITLMRVAEDDQQIKKELIFILSQNDFNRESLLNSMIEKMRMEGAPQEFIQAIGCLTDKAIASQALTTLTTDY